MKDRITRILEHWFIQEPALFQVLCTHEIMPNTQMECAIRSGRRRLEYNPDYLSEMSDEGLEEAMRTEAVRILLKHPYERKPNGCSQQAIAVGSNLFICDNYQYDNFQIEKPEDYDLESGMSYEWYSRKVQEILTPSSGDDGIAGRNYDERLDAKACKYGDLSELWDEDEPTRAMINDVIYRFHNWGSLAGDFVKKLKNSTGAADHYHSVAGVWEPCTFLPEIAGAMTVSGRDVLLNYEKVEKELEGYELHQLSVVNDGIYRFLEVEKVSDKVKTNIEAYFDFLKKEKNVAAAHFENLYAQNAYPKAVMYMAKECDSLIISFIVYLKSIQQ